MAYEVRSDRRGAATSVVMDPVERIVWAASPIYVRRAIYLVLAGDIVLILAYIGQNLIGYNFTVLNLNVENNIPTWYSSAKLFGIAAALALVALIVVARDTLTRFVLVAPAALFLFLSMDEVASIHEGLGYVIDRVLTGSAERGELLFHNTGYWMLVLGPLLAVTMLALGIAYYRLVRPAWSIMRMAALGTGVFLFAAIVVEMGRNLVTHHAAVVLQVTVEEGMELLGVTLILAAALHLAAGKIRQGASQRLARHAREEEHDREREEAVL